MDIFFDRTLATKYHSHAQIARVLTENWLERNMYCPHCGNPKLLHCKNNLPVHDFSCPFCGNGYELKSKNGNFGNKVNDGAYATMISRITSKQNPDFFFLSYSKADFVVRDLILVPKYCFYPSIIEKRKPLEKTARRAGWTGCKILIDKIPKQGRIPIIVDGVVIDKKQVLQSTEKSHKLENHDIKGRSWQMDMINCINMIEKDEFCLRDVYNFEKVLQAKYPENHHIKEKIRQQLQLLRDRNIIQFLGAGHYIKTF